MLYGLFIDKEKTNIVSPSFYLDEDDHDMVAFWPSYWSQVYTFW